MSDPWPEEVRKAVDDLENKYDIELVSGDHHADWVRRSERQEKTIERLQAENASHLEELEHNQAAVIRLKAKIERLWAALKPFADAAKLFAPYPDKMKGNEVEVIVTLEQLRNAARLAAEQIPEKK